MPTLRPGTVDKDVWNGMGKEYPLVPMMEAKDIVLDLGAHIGSFARYAFDRGSRSIYSFEADKENFDIAVENFREHTDGWYKNQPPDVIERHANFFNGAIVRSDDRKDDPMFFGGYLDDIPGVINTGGGNVFGREAVDMQTLKTNQVRTFPLDDVIPFILKEAGKSIRVMKIDIEGSEWPVLYTSKRFSKRTVDLVVGEYHMPGTHEDEATFRKEQGLTHTCTLFGLSTFLQSRGYKDVRIAAPYTHYRTPQGWRIGSFSAE